MFVSFYSMSLAATAVKLADQAEARRLFDAAYTLSADADLPALCEAGHTILSLADIARQVTDENGRSAQALFEAVAEDAAEQIAAKYIPESDYASATASLLAQLRVMAAGGDRDAIIDAITLTEPVAPTGIDLEDLLRDSHSIAVGAPGFSVTIEIDQITSPSFAAVIQDLNGADAPITLLHNTLDELVFQVKASLKHDAAQAA